MNRRSIFPLLTALAFLVAAALMAAWPQNAETTALKREESRVTIATARPDRAERTVSFPGLLRASGEATLSFEASGRIADRPARVGDRVEAGQTLATLDSQPYQIAESAAAAARTEVEARLAQVERDRARVEALFDQKAATREELEQITTSEAAIQASRDAALAQQEEADRMLRETLLRAPFSGTITAVHAEPGEWTAPGMPVVEIAGGTGLEVKVQLPESMRKAARPGAQLRVRFPLSEVETRGTVTGVSSASPGVGRLYEMTVRVDTLAVPDGGTGSGDALTAAEGPPPNADPGASVHLAPGMAADVLVPLSSVAGLEVPLSAVVNPGSSRPTVFLLRGGRVREVPVELLEIRGESVLVRGDLTQGDSVVTAGHYALMDGDAVEVTR